jgi:SRSO17 transposase
VRSAEVAAVRSRLEEFAAEVFAALPRSDQRATGELYVRGLLLDGQRKSMQPMAGRLGVDHQRLQQFMTSQRSVKTLENRSMAAGSAVLQAGNRATHWAGWTVVCPALSNQGIRFG